MLCLCTTFLLSFHRLIDITSCLICFLDGVNRAATSKDDYASLREASQSFGCAPRRRIAWARWADLVLAFLRTFPRFPQWMHQFAFPTAVNEGFLLLPSSPVLAILFFLVTNLTGVKWNLKVVLEIFFLNHVNVWVWMWMCTFECGALWGQRRAWTPQSWSYTLGSSALWVLGINSGSL